MVCICIGLHSFQAFPSTNSWLRAAWDPYWLLDCRYILHRHRTICWMSCSPIDDPIMDFREYGNDDLLRECLWAHDAAHDVALYLLLETLAAMQNASETSP